MKKIFSLLVLTLFLVSCGNSADAPAGAAKDANNISKLRKSDAIHCTYGGGFYEAGEFYFSGLQTETMDDNMFYTSHKKTLEGSDVEYREHTLLNAAGVYVWNNDEEALFAINDSIASAEDKERWFTARHITRAEAAALDGNADGFNGEAFVWGFNNFLDEFDPDEDFYSCAPWTLDETIFQAPEKEFLSRSDFLKTQDNPDQIGADLGFTLRFVKNYIAFPKAGNLYLGYNEYFQNK